MLHWVLGVQWIPLCTLKHVEMGFKKEAIITGPYMLQLFHHISHSEITEQSTDIIPRIRTTILNHRTDKEKK